MSITDLPSKSASSTAEQSPSATGDAGSAWRRGWWHVLDIRVGVVPLPVYLLLIALIAAFTITGKVPSDLTMSIAILAVGGFFFMELGHRIPLLGLMGGAAIMAFVVPSAMTYYGLIPPSVAESVTTFTKTSNFLYLYIAAIIVGSIMTMNRSVLIAGFIKIFIPIACASVAAAIVGTLTGMAMGLDASHSFFFIVVPIMAGGLGEGAIPLSIGYSLILSQPQEQIFAQIIPIVMLGGFTAVLLCGLLNLLGKKFPHLTGEGQLQQGLEGFAATDKPVAATAAEPTSIAAAGVMIVSLYLVGVLVQRLCEFPAPITMLFLAVIMKLARLVSPKLEHGSSGVYIFFSRIVTWPLLFAMGIALTPWQPFVGAFTVTNVVTVVATVASLIGSGFFVARFVKMYPIDVAIVAGCHSGQGGTGDIAILTAANRMQLMPFAQISTRICGAITVTLVLLVFRHLG